MDITQVERVYAIDWMLKAVFDPAALSQSFVLRGGSALRYVYSAEFPTADDPEFILTQPVDDDAMYSALTTSLVGAANASGLKFSLVSYERGSGKIEYTGPLGRRSAAQPRVTLSAIRGQPRREPARLPLLHPFSDDCTATIAAITLDEFIGEQIAVLARAPRAHDVFTLWFAVTKLRDRVNPSQVSGVAQQVAKEKNVALPSAGSVFNSKHRVTLGRAWDNALHEVRGHPSIAQAENDLTDALKFIFAN